MGSWEKADLGWGRGEFAEHNSGGGEPVKKEGKEERKDLRERKKWMQPAQNSQDL